MKNWFSQKLSQPEWPLEKAIDDYVKNYLSEIKKIGLRIA